MGYLIRILECSFLQVLKENGPVKRLDFADIHEELVPCISQVAQ
jgi:hypothetical protein